MERVIEVTDPAVVRALAHPLRRRILTALRGRTASPREIASEFDESLPKLSYHVRQLAAAGLLRLVEERPRRGVTEHFYTAAGRTHIPTGIYDALPSGTKHALARSWLKDVAQTIEAELASGAYETAGARLNRVTVQLDEPARARLANAVDDLYQLAIDLEADSRGRQSTAVARTLITLLSSDALAHTDPGGGSFDDVAVAGAAQQDRKPSSGAHGAAPLNST